MSATSVLDGMLDLVFPKRCVVCKWAGGWLCEPCAGRLHPLPARHCRRCGAPLGRSALRSLALLPEGSSAGAVSATTRGLGCPECRGRELSFASAAAAFCYEGPARALVTACKFRALRSLADDMARRAGPAFAAAYGGASGPAQRAASGFGSSLPVVTSVPAHRDHRLERGFDPAELLARRLARGAGLTYAPLLRRVRHGARQSGLGRAARAANVRQAFALREDGIRVGKELKRVIIVDDVYTTGETLNQCAQALATAGLEPHVFTFARTVRAASVPASREQAVPKERCS